MDARWAADVVAALFLGVLVGLSVSGTLDAHGCTSRRSELLRCHEVSQLSYPVCLELGGVVDVRVGRGCWWRCEFPP